MPYIGNTSANRFVASKAASVFSGTGSQTEFTLAHGVGSDEDILVSVDGVIQEPSVAYSVSGTTLTFTAAPSSNSGNNIFVYYLFRTVGTVSHPSSNALEATSGTFSTTLDVTGNVTIGDGSEADKKIVFDGNAQDFYIGLDDSSDILAIGNGTDVGASRAIIVDANGIVRKSQQPAFLARCGSGDNNNIPINAGTTISFTTEVFDQNSDFNLSTNVFTAPVTGKYQLSLTMTMGNGDTGTDYIQFEIQASNRSFYWIIDPDNWDQDATLFSAPITGLMDMDANDTAKIVVYMNNTGSAQMDTLNYCYFSGHLVA